MGGALFAIRTLLPKRPDVVELLRRSPVAPVTVFKSGKSSPAWAEQLGARLVKSPAVATRLPSQDLKLLGQTPAELAAKCVAFAVLGLFLPQGSMLLAAAAGVGLPLPIPVGAALVASAFMVFKCIDDVRDEAKALRHEYRYAVISLLERLMLVRTASAGAAGALIQAASVGDRQPAQQIRAALDHARLTGTNGWTALEQLGRDLGIPELSHPARALALAGEERTAINNTLSNQIDLLRTALHTDRMTRANQASEQMELPILAVGLSLVLFMVVPAMVRILNI
ncbi:hypothetical protein G6045_08760 [Streptomyces sp. YC504]|uniref:Type II secretion system protein GspF domain-containing protein n=1 Tax=Streptomyces mesophilus TaxID=1775132 RepID=A0A6G4XEV2_9ACTN|nr:type II secretion system F family protein [Streptomyces mesophilus]NGO75763.1 hypothetical protein [Streptomyces mesophilus]